VIVLQEDTGNLESLVQGSATIKKIIAQYDFILHFEFEIGLEGTFDMKPLIQHDLVFKILADPEIFKTIKVVDNGDSLQWTKPQTNETFYIAAEILNGHIWRSKREN
jgi:hypothetical protein